MSTLITMGCSFIQGVGTWYEEIEPITPNNWDYHLNKYQQQHLDIQLNNCIGSYIQEKLGYSYFYNFGISGTSLSNQLRVWFDNTPNIDDTDVLFLLFGTYPSRIGAYLGGQIGDVDLTDSFFNMYPFNKELEPRSIDTIKLDLDLEFIYNIKIIKNYCESRNWDFNYSLINPYNLELYHNEIGETFPNPFIEFEKLSNDMKCHISPHPNKLGYEHLSNKLIEWGNINKPNWYKNDKVISKQFGWEMFKFDTNLTKHPYIYNRF